MFTRIARFRSALVGGSLCVLLVTAGAAWIREPQPVSRAASRGIIVTDSVSKTAALSADLAGKRGVLAASLLASPAFRPRLDAGFQGIALAEELGDEDLLKPGEYADEIELISRLNALGRVQPWAAMSNAGDRVERYRQLEAEFSEALSKASAARDRMTELRQVFTQQVRQHEAQRRDYEKRYFAALNSSASQDAEKWHRLFVETQVSWVKARAELGKANGILSRLSRGIPPARAQYEALRKNRDALIAGIRVDGGTARRAGVVETANP